MSFKDELRQVANNYQPEPPIDEEVNKIIKEINYLVATKLPNKVFQSIKEDITIEVRASGKSHIEGQINLGRYLEIGEFDRKKINYSKVEEKLKEILKDNVKIYVHSEDPSVYFRLIPYTVEYQRLFSSETKVKYTRYGELFLDRVVDLCHQEGITVSYKVIRQKSDFGTYGISYYFVMDYSIDF